MNKQKVFKIISWFLVILWMLVIFWLSDMSGVESRNKSKGTISTVVETTIDTTNKIGITDEHPTKEEIDDITDKLNYPLRKLMHMGEYFILAILLYNAFYQSGIRNKKIMLYSILICFLYACSDEFHQLFRERTGHFSDVLIDTTGGVIAMVIIRFRRKRVLKNNM